MEKNFQEWHSLKVKIESVRRLPLFHEREIWWCILGVNIGVEEDGKNSLFGRPVLIFRKFNKEMFWGLPLTSSAKSERFYYSFILRGKMRTVILSQIRTLSSKRLTRKIGKVSENKYRKIKLGLIALINKTDPLRGPRVPDGNLYNHATKSEDKSQERI